MLNTLYFAYRPATFEVPQIIGLIDAGMSLARLNIAHGDIKVSSYRTIDHLSS